jgi:post-segregation antitoxin (ccd killing protein)
MVMKSSHDAGARKRPVNLTLNADLVDQAKRVTENLSAVVESLLVDYVAREQRDRLARSKAIEASLAAWNKFNEEMGSFADEYSSL